MKQQQRKQRHKEQPKKDKPPRQALRVPCLRPNPVKTARLRRMTARRPAQEEDQTECHEQYENGKKLEQANRHQTGHSTTSSESCAHWVAQLKQGGDDSCENYTYDGGTPPQHQ